MRKLRHRGVRQVAQGYMTGKWPSWDLHSLTPEPTLVTLHLPPREKVGLETEAAAANLGCLPCWGSVGREPQE